MEVGGSMHSRRHGGLQSKEGSDVYSKECGSVHRQLREWQCAQQKSQGFLDLTSLINSELHNSCVCGT